MSIIDGESKGLALYLTIVRLLHCVHSLFYAVYTTVYVHNDTYCAAIKQIVKGKVFVSVVSC